MDKVHYRADKKGRIVFNEPNLEKFFKDRKISPEDQKKLRPYFPLLKTIVESPFFDDFNAAYKRLRDEELDEVKVSGTTYRIAVGRSIYRFVKEAVTNYVFEEWLRVRVHETYHGLEVWLYRSDEKWQKQTKCLKS